MGFRFRKSFGPRGFKVNISKRGISSISIGRAPFTVNVPVNRPGGTRTTISIPGSGMSWSEEAPSAGRALAPAQRDRSALLERNRTVARQDSGQQQPNHRLNLAIGIGIAVLPLALIAGGGLYNEALLRSCNAGDTSSCSLVSPEKVTNPEFLAKREAEAKAEAEAQAVRVRMEQAAAAEEQRQEQLRQQEEQLYQQALADERAATERMNADGYYEGRRGGCFRYTSSGRKDYVDRSICAGY